MANLIAEFNRIVFRRSQPVPTPSNFEFIKFRKSLFSALSDSRKKGNVVGVYAAALGEGMFVTAVEDIYNDHNEQIIVLKRYDLSGAILQRNTLSITEIKAICVFDMPYRNPVLTNA